MLSPYAHCRVLQAVGIAGFIGNAVAMFVNPEAAPALSIGVVASIIFAGNFAEEARREKAKGGSDGR